MSATTLPVGNTIPLTLQLEDGATTLFPQAVVRNPAGTALTGSPFDLAHVGSGKYTNISLSMPVEDFIEVTYIVFTNSGHTIESPDHLRADDVFVREGAIEAVVASGLDPAEC